MSGAGRSRPPVGDRRDLLRVGGAAALGITTLALPRAAAHATPLGGSSTGYAAGDEGPAGGLVFLTPDGGGDGYYYEAAPSDASATRTTWRDPNPYAVLADARGTAVGTGAANTAAMIAAGDTAGSAHLATSYRGGGFSDWFLPSRDELVAMWTNLGELLGFGGSTSHWTSTEASANYAFHLRASDRTIAQLIKATTAHTRPVRRFTAS